MYRQILESIDGIGVYPVITLLLFFIFFLIMILWLFRMDKTYLHKMEQLPLDQNEPNKNLMGEPNEII